jgi:hypothetical protein
MKITREIAAQLNPLIDDGETDGTLYRIGYVVEHLQGLFIAGKPDNMSNGEASGIFYIFGCIQAAIVFETEGVEEVTRHGK